MSCSIEVWIVEIGNFGFVQVDFDEGGGVHASDRAAGAGFVETEHWVEG